MKTYTDCHENGFYFMSNCMQSWTECFYFLTVWFKAWTNLNLPVWFHLSAIENIATVKQEYKQY